MSYIGEIKKRITVTAIFKKSFDYVSYKFCYSGTTHFTHIFEDLEGNVIVWKSTNPVDYVQDGCYKPIPLGSKVELTGTVKDHTTYKDVEQTVVTRCNIKLIELGKTKQEIQKEKAKTQMTTLNENDFIWEMPYRQYKEHYSDCETICGSYDIEFGTIKVIIREGRLKNSGTRGRHFSYYHFAPSIEHQEKGISYRAVSEENARKQFEKQYPDCKDWVCVDIYR